MTYNEMLNLNDWKVKCNEILQRDHYICRDCGHLGYHNSGRSMTLKCVEEIDKLLYDHLFFNMPFSKFYDWSSRININKMSTENIKCFGENEYEETIHGHFDLHLGHLGLGLISSFPIIYKKHQEPKNLRCCYFTNCIKRGDCSEGNLLMVALPYTTSSIYLSLKGVINSGSITLQLENRLFSIIYKNTNHLLKGLNIHHTQYIVGHKPWEYENDSLVTLCEDCHKKRHETSNIPLYDQDKRLISNLVPCSRCGGSGYLPPYNHVWHGICFKCYGEGVIIDSITNS